jgi:hypothetical protein
MASHRSWATADNSFWSNHVAAWYRGVVEVETYSRKHDFSATSLIRCARHLPSAEDLRKRAEHLRNCSRKRRNGSRNKGR